MFLVRLWTQGLQLLPLSSFFALYCRLDRCNGGAIISSRGRRMVEGRRGRVSRLKVGLGLILGSEYVPIYKDLRRYSGIYISHLSQL
jgi:hypothetical protein